MKKQEKPEDQGKATSRLADEKGGVDRRLILGGLGGITAGALAGGGALGALAGGRAESSGWEWGPRVDLKGLKENYAPQEVRPFTVPAGGIDNLALHSTDVFTILGLGEFTVDFKGYFRVARANPTTSDWATAEVRVNIIDLKLVGRHEKIGEIVVSLNPDMVSSGQILPKPASAKAGVEEPKDCRIATAAVFDLGKLGAVFNKEPILLMNEHVTRIPPVDDPSGHALLFKLPLFSKRDPQGEPVAYLTSLRYGADNYISESEARAFRELRPKV